VDLSISSARNYRIEESRS